MTEEENFLVVCKLCRRPITERQEHGTTKIAGKHYHQWCLDRAIENREAMTARVRELEGLATQSATATILANLDTRTERSRADAVRKDADTLYELKGWLRLCADTPAGHAEFYEWASHYMFGTPPPADRPGAGAAE